MEFGVLAPVFFVLVLGVMDFGSMMYAQAAVEAGARMSSRFGITGKADASSESGISPREVDEIKARVKNFGFGLSFTDDRLAITPKVYPSYDDIPEPFRDLNANGTWDTGEPFTDINGNGVWDGGVGTAGVGGADSIVLYEIRYEWHPLSMLTSYIFTGEASGRVFLTAYSVVRNEPWEGASNDEG